jgi:hypothetical protein
MEKIRYSYRLLIGKRRKRLLGKYCWRRWEDNLKMGHEEVRVWTGVIRSVTRTGDDGLL